LRPSKICFTTRLGTNGCSTLLLHIGQRLRAPAVPSHCVMHAEQKLRNTC
jgi:hypothetical protein